MTRIAVIAKINDSWIDLLSLNEVEGADSESCNVPGSCDYCGCRVGGQTFRADIPKDLIIKVGDRVEVSASAVNALGTLLALISIPALSGFLSWKFIDILAISEPVKVLAAVLGSVLGIGITILVAGKENSLPEITRILE